MALSLGDHCLLSHYQRTDYWFNARLNNLKTTQTARSEQTITLGDGNDGRDSIDARYHLLEIPQKWRSDENSPLYRHLDGANFAFADGHVKWIMGSNWKNGLDCSGDTKATFRLKAAK